MLKNFVSRVKNIFDAKLPFEIVEEFKPIDKEYLEEEGSCIEKLSDEILIIDIDERLNSKMSFFISLTMVIVFVIGGFITNEGFEHPFLIILLIVSFLSSIYFLMKIFNDKKALIILNRKSGFFTFPYRINKYKSYTTPFNKAIVYWVGTGGATGNLSMELVAQHPDKKMGGASLMSHERDYRKIWSFYVWYMDKNRPLPPGTAFDPFRQADFERRKSEVEREKYWKDELEVFTREPHSVMYNPEIHEDWIKVQYVKADKTPLGNIYYRFEFEDGAIVYMQTDKEGNGFEPPKTAKFEGVQLDIAESWF